VLRVNGDDPEAAHRAAVIALAFWARFHRDIVIDLVCYRRQGHNELDEPRYTQAPMYAAIDARPTLPALYGGALEARGVVDGAWIAARVLHHRDRFTAAHDASQSWRPNAPQRFTRQWAGLRLHRAGDKEDAEPTGVDLDLLRRLGAALHDVPQGFAVHPNLARQIAQRASTIARGRDIAWAAAELLALACLLHEGTGVRLTGEDTRRGTFSQRHAVILDQSTGAEHVPLAAIASNGARLEIHDSPLSEAAVLGYEYGYSLADPHTLVAWEAQFGDFANVAQTFIDNYLANGEDKWCVSSGLVLLLPHGLEGGGPEHSSARIERFLQLCARDNMAVVNCTTPANHFHALRRQMKRDYRKPLVAMTPKLMLRHRGAVSAIEEFGPRSRFRPLLTDLPGRRSRRRIARIVLCSGRIWFALDAARRDAGRDDVALVRIEELYPFPARELARLLAPHNEAEIVWCQEEPRNMGAWGFLDRRLEAVLREAGRKRPTVRYAGRPEATVPAAATRPAYEREQRAVIAEALSL
jgi:2-oxoglutarate dehydrogenase E1 component